MTPKTKAIIGIIIAALLIAIGIWWFEPSTDNQFAKASWHSGGEALTAVFTVLNPAGHPVAGAKVRGWNSLGYTQGVTGTNGVTTIRFGDPALVAVDVDGNRVVDRTFPLASTLYLGNGLNVRIQLKP